ncbi:MAG: FAD-binding oxidoreductase [Streptosporangiaceae bacterium]
MARDHGGISRAGTGRSRLPGGLTVSAQFARAELPQGPPVPAAPPGLDDLDRALVRESFGRLLAAPGDAIEFLFARLFVEHPELRGLFPLSMEQTRAALAGLLGRLIGGLDDRDASDRLLGQVARDHRKYGVHERHYEPFFDALVATVREASGPAWSGAAEAAWRSAADYFRAVMKSAAQDAGEPAWWVGEVVQHELRTPTIAVLTIRPDQPFGYLPGQHLWLQAPRWPRIWRRYSIANVPRENGLLDIHVRAVPGGLISSTLVGHCAAGDTVILGAARGHLAVPAAPDRNIVCVAGGTGLAPAKAIIEAVISAVRPGRRRNVTLYLGARTAADLYDLRDLETLRLAYPQFTIIPVTRDGSGPGGRAGRLPDVLREHASFRDTDVYVTGPAGLVTATARVLTGRVAPERLHHDPLDALRAASDRTVLPGAGLPGPRLPGPRLPEAGPPEAGPPEAGPPAGD